MKKILTVSLVAMMAVSAARAEIASVAYVDRVSGQAQAGAEAAAAEALTSAKGELNSAIALKADKTALDGLSTTVSGIDTAYKAADVALGQRIDGLTGTGGQAAVTNETFNTFKEENTAAIAEAKAAGTDAAAALNTYKGEMTNTLKNYSTTTQMNTAITDNAVNTVASGTANGTIAVDGKDVAVKGLGSAAYTEASAYATSTQGAKADAALPQATFEGMLAKSATGNNAEVPTVGYMIDSINNTQSELSGDITGLGTRLTTAEGDIDDIEASLAVGGATANAIAEAKAAGTDAAAALNTYKGEMTNTLKNYSTTTQMNTAITDNAVNTVASGTANGTIAVDGKDVAVKGLGSAAYTASTAYDAAGTAQNKVNELATGQVATNTNNIGTINTNLGPLAGVKIPEACATTAVCSLVMNKGSVAWEVITY